MAGREVRFDGQAVVVTGGGRGLGRVYCLELARRGAAVVVNDVAEEHAAGVVAEIEAGGGVAVAAPESVATPKGGEAIVGRCLESFGTVDALVNNAGILRSDLFEDLTVEQIDAVLDVNLRGAFFVTQPAWRIMKASGYGRVIFTSSAAGLFSRPGSVNYSASKAAMYGMCRALSFEGAEHGISVNVVLPRAVTTIAENDAPPGLAASYAPGLREALRERATPEATAGLVCFLLSRECPVTGEAFASTFGSYARVFVGRTAGWLAPDLAAVTAEAIAEHFDRLRALDGFTVPLSNADEAQGVARQLGLA